MNFEKLVNTLSQIGDNPIAIFVAFVAGFIIITVFLKSSGNDEANILKREFEAPTPGTARAEGTPTTLESESSHASGTSSRRRRRAKKSKSESDGKEVTNTSPITPSLPDEGSVETPSDEAGGWKKSKKGGKHHGDILQHFAASGADVEPVKTKSKSSPKGQTGAGQAKDSSTSHGGVESKGGDSEGSDNHVNVEDMADEEGGWRVVSYKKDRPDSSSSSKKGSKSSKKTG